MSETHHFDLPHYGRVSLRLDFDQELIKGRIEFPKVINSRRNKRLLERWLKGITSALDPDPRQFVMISTIGGKLAAFGHESAGQVIGAYFPR